VVTFVGFKKDQVAFTKGERQIYNSSPGVGRAFCRQCGTPLTWEGESNPLEERGLEYILGVRERSTKEVREVVLADEVPLVTITVRRQKRPDTELQAKQARLGKVRYIVCRNPAEAERDAAGRGLHPSSKPNGEWARNLSRRPFGEPYNAAQNALASSMVGSGQLEPARSSVIR
jgi:hypothetical protein